MATATTRVTAGAAGSATATAPVLALRAGSASATATVTANGTAGVWLYRRVAGVLQPRVLYKRIGTTLVQLNA